MSAPEQLPEPLSAIENALLKAGRQPDQDCQLLRGVTESRESQAPIQALKTSLGEAASGDMLERLLLFHAARQASAQVGGLPVHDSVKQLIRKDLTALQQPRQTLEIGSYGFIWASKIATLRRFPAGPMDWEMSGVPRSWLLKPPAREMVRLAAFIATKLGGFRPCFFMHVAPKPRNRALVIEKEVIRSYWRMARSLELQPGVRAIMAAAWFHDPQAIIDNPHLVALNRPYLEHGGLVTVLGPADERSGMLEGNLQRRKQHEAGELSYRVGLAIWPREAAIRWAHAHPEYEP